MNRSVIKSLVQEVWWEEAYDHDLIDDESFGANSKLVPNDVKRKIKDWIKKMRLSSRS